MPTEEAKVHESAHPVGAAMALQLQAAVLSRRRFDEAAATFATQLAQLFHFERVCVGFIEEGYASVVAISHGPAVDPRQEQNRAVAAAMEEAIDQAASISYPPHPTAPPRITLAHAALARQHGGMFFTVPIVDLDLIVGAVTAQRAAEQPLSAEEQTNCEDLVSLAGPLLALKRESERSWPSRARLSLKSLGSRLAGPGEVGVKVSAAALAVAAALLFLVPFSYDVTAPARLEGSIQRALVAASDGFLEQVAVRPGDAVKEGQVLAELAQQDLKLERSKWESELAQQVTAYGAALARADRSLLMVNHAKAAEARAHLELIEKQIERAQLRAPFDGVVISGNLSDSIGAPVKRGDVLLVMAPRERYRLIVEVDERDIADVKPGAAGRITLAALPAQSFSFTTERVTPLAATREGRHFFEVEGRIEAGGPALRPGLRGIARIEAEARPLAARLFRRVLAWARLTLWSWGWLG